MINDMIVRVGETEGDPAWENLDSNRVYDLSMDDIAYFINKGAGGWPNNTRIITTNLSPDWGELRDQCNEAGLLDAVAPEPEPEPEPAPDADTEPVEDSEPAEDADEPTLEDIPHLRDDVIEQMREYGLNTPKDLLELTADQLTLFNGVGEVTANGIVGWLAETYG